MALINNSLWEEIESVVAESAWNIYQQVGTDVDRRIFCEHLRAANADRLHCYGLPRCGESYLLWHHMLRMDNICVALKCVQQKLRKNHSQFSMPRNMKVLDIGSGTGNGVMAVTYLLARLASETPRSVEVWCVENSNSMRESASYALSSYFELLEASFELSVSPPPFQWQFWEGVNDIEACAIADSNKDFRLILLSHTFDEYDEVEWKVKKEQISEISRKHLNESGVMVFLTPYYGNKISQMQDLSGHLEADGMTHLRIRNIPREQRFDPSKFEQINGERIPEKRPLVLKNMRERFNQECVKLGVQEALPIAKRDDLPYYYFKCDVDVFFREKDEAWLL